jgi:uncharacterized damage-inducible protein DinB
MVPGGDPAISIGAEFLQVSRAQLLSSLEHIETCVRKLSDAQIWQRHSENENAVGNLLLHLSGNVRQWIVSGIGGAPDGRDRNSEFAARTGAGKEELLRRLRETVEEALAVIERFPSERLLERMSPQGYNVTVLGAIYHVVEHFCGHAYQIIFLTKFLTGQDLGFYAYLSGNRQGGTGNRV